MRKIFFVILIMVPVASLFAQQKYEPGIILLQVIQPELVSFSNGQVINGSPQLQAVFQKYPATNSRKLSHVNAETDGCYRIEYAVDFALETIRDAIVNCPDIKYANLAYYGILCSEPNDPLWTDQWALQKIELPNAWDITKPNSAILVGIMDTGLDYTHEDLADNIWTNPNEIAGNGVDDDGNGYFDDILGWDFVGDGDNDPQEDGDSHGTRVAGVIAARTYNGIGVAGIAGGWQSLVGVRLIGLRITGFDGWTEDRAKEAIEYLTWLRQHYGYIIIANMSFQTQALEGSSDEPMDMFEASVNAARQAGIIMIAAAGNTINNPKSKYYQPEVETLPIPARYIGVLAIGASKDGATLQDEKRSVYSLYDTEVNKLLVVAPVDTCVTSGINIYTTYPYPANSYDSTFHGTSAACPIAVGEVSLMLSINPSLSYSEISNIFAATAEKIGNYNYGSSGRTDEVGYGRINAYQAVLLALAYDNKSTISAATAYNSPRILAKGKNSTSTLHEVFYSGRYDASSDGWEVFYRRSSDNGASWDISKRISSGDSHNRRQCISVTDEGSHDGVHAVWQRKKDNGKYQVVYRNSTNTGSSWQDAVLLADDVSCSSSQSVGPMPVITSITSGSAYKLIVVWVTSGGLRYRIYNNGQWENTGALDHGSYNSKVWFPSIMGKGGFASLTYDTRTNGGVYSRIYNGTTWSSANEVTAGSSSVNDRYSQIAIRISNNPIAAWCAQKSSDQDYRILFRSGFSDNSWSSWFEEFDPETGKHCYYPSLTDYSGNGNYGISIVYYTSDKEIKMKKWVSGEWQPYTLNSNAIFANITYESVPNSIPKIIWTDQAGSPYQLVLSSQYLSKFHALASVAHHRRAVFENKTDHTSLAIERGEVTVKTEKEQIFSIDFPPVDIFQKITINNIDDALYYLIPDTVTLPQDVKQLKLTQIVYTTSPYDSVGAEPGTEFKNFDVELILKNLSKGDSIAVTELYSNNEGKFNLEQQRIFDIANFAGQIVVLKHKLHNLSIKERNLTFGAGNVWLEREGMPKATPQPLAVVHRALPQAYQISQNYPNPFNPTTTISYKIPAGKEKYLVTLKIYDVLGRLIKILVETYQASGSYKVIWDGTDMNGRAVASGIYFYTIQAGDFRQTKKMVLMR